MLTDNTISSLLRGVDIFDSVMIGNGSPIEGMNEDKLCSFVGTLRTEKANIIFRGDKTEIFNSTDVLEISYRIFMLGPKAESFWKQRSRYLKKNICKNLIVDLYSEFKKAFTMECIKSVNTKKHLKDFMNSEYDFVSYFKNENSADFYNKISGLPECDKQFVLDYYNAILHSMGHLVHHGSYQISTTKSLEVAKDFASDIIYIAWIPKENVHNRLAICLSNRELCNEKIFAFGLPTCKLPSVFPEQSEVCMKFGILPHFLLGFIYEKKFVVNPNLFSTFKSFEKCVVEGFDVDQSGFNEVLGLTKYKRSYVVCDGYYCEIAL